MKSCPFGCSVPLLSLVMSVPLHDQGRAELYAPMGMDGQDVDRIIKTLQMFREVFADKQKQESRP